jgi:acetoin utilization deacetylase AcuC-like enzyme
MVHVFTSPACARHQVPAGFPECPERLIRILDQLAGTDWPVREVPTHPASRGLVESVHDPGYVGRFEEAVAGGASWLDSGDNPISSGSWEAAWGAVDATLAAVDWAMAGAGRAAFAAVRPPGHHAERAFAMGFCFFNNVVVAAEYARRHLGCDRVAIVDHDVHHGNGTQHLLEDRGDVLYASLHQWPFFPGTGAAEEIGTGDGRGATINVPLAAGSADARYRRAFETEILPAVRAFAPDLLMISAGFDAWQGDPLGGMRVTRDGYADWGRLLGRLAAEVCDGRIVLTLEGGYDLRSIPGLVVSHLEAIDAALESGRSADAG